MKNVIISENIVKNGTFDSLEGWNSTFITLEDGKAHFGIRSVLNQQIPVQSGSIVRIKLTIEEPDHAGTICMVSIGGYNIPDVFKYVSTAGTSEFDLIVPGNEGEGRFLGVHFSPSMEFKLDNVEIYLLGEGEQLLKNGDFSNGLESWEASPEVTSDDSKALLVSSSSIEQTVKQPSLNSFTLNFNVSSIEGEGTVFINNGMEKLTFANNGLHTLEFPADPSDANIAVRFSASGSFELDDVELFASAKPRR